MAKRARFGTAQDFDAAAVFDPEAGGPVLPVTFTMIAESLPDGVHLRERIFTQVRTLGKVVDITTTKYGPAFKLIDCWNDDVERYELGGHDSGYGSSSTAAECEEVTGNNEGEADGGAPLHLYCLLYDASKQTTIVRGQMVEVIGKLHTQPTTRENYLVLAIPPQLRESAASWAFFACRQSFALHYYMDDLHLLMNGGDVPSLVLNGKGSAIDLV